MTTRFFAVNTDRWPYNEEQQRAIKQAAWPERWPYGLKLRFVNVFKHEPAITLSSNRTELTKRVNVKNGTLDLEELRRKGAEIEAAAVACDRREEAAAQQRNAMGVEARALAASFDAKAPEYGNDPYIEDVGTLTAFPEASGVTYTLKLDTLSGLTGDQVRTVVTAIQSVLKK